MKKAVLFTYREEIGKIYYDDLARLFGDYMDLRYYSLNKKEEPSKDQITHADLILVSNAEIINKIHYLIDERSKIILIDFSYSEINIAQMREYPAGTYAFVHFDLFVCRKMVNIFYEHGINNFIWLFPQEDGRFPIAGYDVVIMDDYSSKEIPENKKIINLGKRKIAFSTLLKIALEAEIFDKDLENQFLIYCYSYKSATSIVNSIYGDMDSFHSQVRLILNYMDSAIAILNDEYAIIEYNFRFTDMFRINFNLYGKKINEIEEVMTLVPYVMKGKEIHNELIVYPSTNISLALDMECIERGINKSYNYMLILQEIGEVEKKSHSLKRQFTLKGYTSKYRFSDIKTVSYSMEKCINKAEKIAKIDKTTLIVGESGTGKEMMAQSIHSASKRAKYPFICINCAAIPASLLESELFGYSEGAFTGSKKGGKKGLFEMANYGTLFLDEIGEASSEVQSKLLRAIETKEIMPLGSDKIIAVDVRILAATNRNLKELVEKKEFRLDLYYRLNSIIIKIQPLRERKEDIRFLAERFIYEETHKKREADSELWSFLEQYSWPGNIRELKNIMEYMVNITEEPLHLSDLPDYIMEEMEEIEEIEEKEEMKKIVTEDKEEIKSGKKENRKEKISDAEEIFENYSPRDKKMMERIVSLVRDGVKSRKEICNRLNAEGTACTEYRLRKVLEDLKAGDLIYFSRGPEGITITSHKM